MGNRHLDFRNARECAVQFDSQCNRKGNLEMCMKQIEAEAKVEAARNSYGQAIHASRVAHSATGETKRYARKIKAIKIQNAVKADPLAFKIGIDDTFQIGMDTIHHELGSLHLTYEVATVCRQYQADARNEVFYGVSL